MLKLNFSPVRSDDSRRVVKWAHPVLSIQDVIVAEGIIEFTEYDLSLLPDGATATHPILGNVSRIGNDYEVTLKLTHGASAPYLTRFPEPIEVTTDGPINLPPYNKELT